MDIMDFLAMYTALMYVSESSKYYFKNMSCCVTHTRDKVFEFQKQPSRKRCSENMQQIYIGTPMPKCDFNKVAKQS